MNNYSYYKRIFSDLYQYLISYNIHKVWDVISNLQTILDTNWKERES